MLDFDVVVVGNGAVGSFAAMALARKFSGQSIAVVGPAHRPGAASAAAGAMAAVYAELERCWAPDDSWNARQLALGLRSRQMWRQFFADTAAPHLVTAEDTLVFLAKQASAFERGNFETMLKYAEADSAGHTITEARSPIQLAGAIDAIALLPGEFGFDAGATLHHMASVLHNLGVATIDSHVAQITPEKGAVVLTLSSGEYLRCERVVVAAGAQTEDLLSDFGIMPMLQGVGSAIAINSAEVLRPLGNYVIRTVNRGGSNCGLHTVPLHGGSIYLGAGNYVSAPGPADHRVETIRWLFTQFEREILGRSAAYAVTGAFRIGMRPRSLDGYPMVGPLSGVPNVYVATATNRLGYCWAPSIAETVVSWMKGTSPFENVPELEGFPPDRDPLPFASLDAALEYFVESRLGAALEHGLLEAGDEGILERRGQLESLGRALMHDVGVIQLANETEPAALNPDNWSALADMRQQRGSSSRV